MEQRTRQNISAFQALIDAPGVLATGFNLPANADLYVSTSAVVGASTVMLEVGTRQVGMPASPANMSHSIGWFEKDKNVKKKAGAPGTVSLYVRDGIGRLFLIGQ